MNTGDIKYKDGLMRKIFSRPDKALHLYNAVTGKNLSSDTAVEIKNIEPVLLSSLRNDLSFIIDGRLVVFIEHQSSLNMNMPLRMLQYLLLFYETHCELGIALYKDRRISLPKPEFYILYNGIKPPPDKQMRLSDAFIGLEEGETPPLELVANIINVNYGKNPEIMEKSEDLKGYAILVAKEREYRNSGMVLAESIRLACEYCIKEGILAEFLLKLEKGELANMFKREYDEELAKKAAKSDGIEEGFEMGIEVGREEGLESGFEKGIVDLIERMLRKGKSI
jgi:predicted transposase YdaD